MSSGMDEYWKNRKAQTLETNMMDKHLSEFTQKHHSADEILVDKDGKVCGAIYYSIHGRNTMDLVSFFRRIKEFFNPQQ